MVCSEFVALRAPFPAGFYSEAADDRADSHCGQHLGNELSVVREEGHSGACCMHATQAEQQYMCLTA
jgi:hypothetical protein